MTGKKNVSGKVFAAINLFNTCPHCGKDFPTRDGWLLHVGVDHPEIAIRILKDAGLR